MDNDFFRWIETHEAEDPARLRLRFAGKSGSIDYASAITQIECRRKFGRKLQQTLGEWPDFYFPSVLSGEQATSDIVASFHASLVAEGLPACDLTAGLGIDVFHAAKRASEIVAVEIDHVRAEALRYNAAYMKADNVSVAEDDCRDFIRRCVEEGRVFDTVFIDPARRASDGSRVFALSDCEPDVVALMPALKKMCRLLIIKVSPMLDITHTLEQMSTPPAAIMAVGTATECKELLVLVNFASGNEETVIEAVTLVHGRASTFAFTLAQERDCPSLPQMPPLKVGDYIYESNPSLMKVGAVRITGSRFGLMAFHPNTRLYGSHEYVAGFPGMACRVTAVYPYASRVLKRFAREYPQINVAVRNFGMGADALRARLGVRDGGSMRLYGLTDASGDKVLAVTEPVTV